MTCLNSDSCTECSDDSRSMDLDCECAPTYYDDSKSGTCKSCLHKHCLCT